MQHDGGIPLYKHSVLIRRVDHMALSHGAGPGEQDKEGTQAAVDYVSGLIDDEVHNVVQNIESIKKISGRRSLNRRLSQEKQCCIVTGRATQARTF